MDSKLIAAIIIAVLIAVAIIYGISATSSVPTGQVVGSVGNNLPEMVGGC